MKLLYLLFSFTVGGTEQLVSDICNEMVRRQHDVHLYIVNDLYDQAMLDKLDKRIHIQLQKRPAGGGQKLQTLRSIASYIRKNRIDVVHCNSLDAPELLLLKPLYRMRTKVLYTVHGMHQLKGKSGFKMFLRNLLCHRVIGISQCVSQDVIDAGIRKSKVVTVPNAIDFSRFPTPSQKTFDPEKPVIGHVARIQPSVKGQDILIRAIGELKGKYPHIRCLFAGSPAKNRPQDLQELEQLVAQLGLEASVEFCGIQHSVADFLGQLDIFALPSRSEGFGISLVEAMSMGIPCVASRLEGPVEVLSDGTYGTMFQPEDHHDLAQSIDRILTSYAQHKQTAVTAMEHVRTEYAVPLMCDRLETIMKQVVL